MAELPWSFLAMSFIVSVPTGFIVYSEGYFWTHTFIGKLAQGLLSVLGIALIAWAFYRYGWKVGLVEAFVVFGGANIGRNFLISLQRRFGP